MWAVTGGGPFMWTTTINGVGGQTVSAEVSIAKYASSWGDPRHVKTAVWSASYIGGPMSGMSQNWGINGAPIRFLANCGTVTFAVEVQRAFADVNCKVYFH